MRRVDREALVHKGVFNEENYKPNATKSNLVLFTFSCATDWKASTEFSKLICEIPLEISGVEPKWDLLRHFYWTESGGHCLHKGLMSVHDTRLPVTQAQRKCGSSTVNVCQCGSLQIMAESDDKEELARWEEFIVRRNLQTCPSLKGFFL